MTDATTEDIRKAAKKLFWAARSMEERSEAVAWDAAECAALMTSLLHLLFRFRSVSFEFTPSQILRAAVPKGDFELITKGMDIETDGPAVDAAVERYWREAWERAVRVHEHFAV